MTRFFHLKEYKQSYLEHFYCSMKFSSQSFLASIIFFIHAIWPDIFQHTGSNMIASLNKKLKYRVKQENDYEINLLNT